MSLNNQALTADLFSGQSKGHLFTSVHSNVKAAEMNSEHLWLDLSTEMFFCFFFLRWPFLNILKILNLLCKVRITGWSHFFLEKYSDEHSLLLKDWRKQIHDKNKCGSDEAQREVNSLGEIQFQSPKNNTGFNQTSGGEQNTPRGQNWF